ncbi:TonB-dependent receptor [Paraglaciecola chathamensis]|uniref:TonB-dependent receptor n=1 Tax=Paraglaciecola chathamensis TaxID=368405 RepID=A0ABS0WJ71_9ALTE|nr:TonB-dependent receptor [Paraglaciecola chathamensis]MBJ2138517.1 TonB-dependent receptor [Paraglaciecola chathamensis]
MSASFKLKPLVLAMMPLLFASNSATVFAQDTDAQNTPSEEEKKKKAEEDLEVIKVSGYRGSVIRSINAKKFSDGVQDSIFAEDIGKSTDQNIADALSRVTGVTVQEADGEGTRISVRGAGAALNQISLNGVALTSGLNGSGSNQSVSDESVDLSTFSSDILSSINVIKTAAADHDEGSLGANVILKTFKPLSVEEDRRSIEIQGRHNEYAEKNNYKLSGTFSEKFLDDNLGVIVTASKETQDTRRDSLGGDWLSPYKVARIREGGATNLDGEVIAEERDALIANGRSFNTFVDTRDRDTLTMGIQFLPTDVTDVQLDLSYSKQTFEQDSHSIYVTTPDLSVLGSAVTNFYNTEFNGTIPETQAHLGTVFTDPQQDWWILDEANNTLVKSINRFASGGFSRQLSGNETENKVATLKINHEITEDLLVEFTAGYSRTDFESLPNASVRTQNWNKVPIPDLAEVPVVDPNGNAVLQPVGFDCSTGQCVLVTGDQPVSYVPTNAGSAASNISPTGFSPYDLNANHLGGLSRYNEEQIDTNKSVFLDFDWAVDFVGVNKVEFGLKYSSRDKEVFTDYQDFSNTDDIVLNPETGEVISGLGQGDITVADFTTGTGLPVSNFFEDLLGSNASEYNTNYLNGWAILDPEKAFAERFQIPNSVLVSNNNGDRQITQDNVSAYAKLNFEYFDSKLTGNIGVRYVKTENTSIGNSTFSFNGQNVAFDPVALIYDKQLANTSLAPCPEAVFINGSVVNADPNIYPCYDSGFSGIVTNPAGDSVDRGFAVEYDADGNVVSQVGQYPQNEPVTNDSRSWYGLLDHRDTSTQGASAQELLDAGLISSLREVNNRAFAGTGENESEIWLPSANLNYAINDELIARFAASKTMARPRFDSLTPGFSASENPWGVDASSIRTNNPRLQPLTSNNIDISLEWYFNKAGLVSVALFRKDMKNFEERVSAEVYLKDIRTDYGLESISLDEVVINPGAETEVINPNDGRVTLVNEVTPFNSDCLPFRVVQVQIADVLPVECRNFQASVLRNGKGSLTQGLEFSYNQSYDFLPGFWSGLGVNFNYTFADSENDSDFDETLQRVVQPVPQAYTPRHSANTTLFWEKNGHQLRLTHRFNSDQFVGEVTNGNAWQDSTTRLDFSATYKWDENITFTLHALNLTDDITRTYFTSRDITLRDADGNVTILSEGNALTDDVYEGRTIAEYKTGRQFRVSARVNF